MFRKKPLSASSRSRPRKTYTKTPLTYYRSGSAPADKDPFDKRPQKPRKMNRALVRAADLAAIILVVSGLVYSLLLKPEVNLSLSSNSYHPTSVYQAYAASRLDSFKNKNKLTVDDREVINSLQAKFPELVSAEFRIPIIGQKPKLNLVVSKPSFFLESAGKKYIVDDQGKVIGTLGEFPNIKNLPVILDQSGFDANKGKQILGIKATTFINVLIAHLERENIKASSLVLPALPHELHLRAVGDSYYVKFFLNSDAQQQIGQYLSARESFSKTGQFPAQYLDVRVPGKIFIK